MSVAEQQLSTDWVVLTHEGEPIAEVWQMPEDGRTTFVFLVPRDRLERGERPVTVAMLLDAATLDLDSVDSWRLGEECHADADRTLETPLPSPGPDDSHLTVYVHLKSPAIPNGHSPVEEFPLEKWQALDVIWKAIISLESSIDATRLGMDGLRAEMDAAFKRPLAVEEKLNALQADIAQWTKAKSRVHHALPKVREFVHRATWAMAVPERKRLEEIIKEHVEPRIPMANVDQFRERLEHLQKDRQVLLATGNAVHQECRGILGEIQRATSTLQRNAAERARQKRSAGREKGKHF